MTMKQAPPDSARRRWLARHRFLEPVARFEDEIDRALDLGGASPPGDEPPWDAVLRQYAAGVPLLHNAGAALSAIPAVAARLATLVGVLATNPAVAELVRQGCASLSEAFADDPAAAPVAVNWVLSAGAGPLPPFPGLLRYLGWKTAARALAPLLAAFAELRDEGRWGRRQCPCCGALAVMGWLVPGDGARERQLSCGQCRTRWIFRRIGCAHCNNDDPGQLSILDVGEEDGFRLDFCEACMGYVKTWTGSGDPTFHLEDWTSLHLDMIARERGYRRWGASLYEFEPGGAGATPTS